MKIESVYRILFLILLPVAGLFAFVDFFAIMAALVQPALWISVFIVACMVIYIYTSYRFFTTGIQQAKPCKHSLKDLIKVNAFVSIFFVVMSYVQTIVLLTQPTLIKTMMIQLLAQQQTNMPPGATADTFVSMMKGILYFLAVISTILLLHIGISFRLLKKYKHVFDTE
ncbi:hypothetical protein GALL_248310 [mine drainage metagenome]|uniref:Uncharacterized protein n=1 Tax=mine drainage metagenome TaxID=410659 RepID=A0A1J5RAV5_9ZZZZ